MDMSNSRSRDSIDGDELDAFCKCRFCKQQRRGWRMRAWIKRKANRRYRQYGKEECRRFE